MIERGDMTEVYCVITPFYCRHFGLKRPFSEADKWNFNLTRWSNADSKYVKLRAFLSAQTMTYKISRIHIGEGNPAWGAVEGKEYFVIGLGNRRK